MNLIAPHFALHLRPWKIWFRDRAVPLLRSLCLAGLLSCQLPAQENVLPGARASELAYFGDLEQLRTLCGTEMTLPALEKATGAHADVLFHAAIDGEAWPVIALLASYGWPAQYPNVESWASFVTPRTIDELAKNIPKFRERVGDALMLYASRQGKTELMKALKRQGIPLSQPEKTLLTAIGRRDGPTITWLLENGADPKQGGPNSALETARKLKSADLLSLLDRQKVLAREIEQLRSETAPQKTSLAGVWACRKEGFGSVLLSLYPDGTGIMTAGVGSFPIQWKSDGSEVEVLALPLPNMPPQENLKLSSEEGQLVLRKAKGGAPIRLTKESGPYERRGETPLRQRPLKTRIRSLVLDDKEVLWIQINGAYGRIELARLIEGAKASTYGRETNALNSLDWESFTPGELPVKDMKIHAVIPVDDRSADPGYSLKCNELFLTHNQPAELKPDSLYTLFRGRSQPVNYTGDPHSNTEYPYAFALLSKEPFANGKRWLLFYLRKGRADRSLP